MVALSITNLVIAAGVALLSGQGGGVLAAQLTRANYPNNATSKVEM
jgi:hypothetical protein